MTGAEGTGRTAFAGAVAAAAERRGDAPLWVVATPSLSSVPFGAFGWLLGDGDPPSDVAATIGRITSALRRHGGAAVTVLVIDDAHLLDERFRRGRPASADRSFGRRRRHGGRRRPAPAGDPPPR